ncbi:MAG: MerR family transcriptional regulator [Deltaproteobacteria bacterium]|nr:MerR family transcriptional regulator [Deltaproteobacteria bacterium]
MAAETYKVKDVARLSGVTVRTLHHYDAIGLLCPTRRTSAGYRLYAQADLLRLQQILVYRELGLPLEKIKMVVSDPQFDARAALVEQRAQLAAKAEQTRDMIRAVDAALRALQGDEDMNTEDLFDGFDPKKYEAEVEQRWGGGAEYAESVRRTKSYSKDDWVRIKAETHDLMQRIAAQHEAGVPPTDPVAMDLAEEHRLQIDRFYYPCSHAMHGNLGQMYTADVRFRDNLDEYGDGVAAFLSAAIEANGQRAER